MFALGGPWSRLVTIFARFTAAYEFVGTNCRKI